MDVTLLSVLECVLSGLVHLSIEEISEPFSKTVSLLNCEVMNLLLPRGHIPGILVER